MAAEARHANIPLVTIGGYLGAGKTTLVNQLLTRSDGRRYVVFVNDFGAINIDVNLVDSVEADRISFSSGCVCCTLNDDFVAAVVALAQGDDRVDGILIEASGVSDPRALEASLRALEAAGHIRFDTALYVIDADHFGRLDYIGTETIIDHAVASDLVLINKADLVDAAQIDAISDMLKVAAPYTHLMSTMQCQVPPEILFGALSTTRNGAAQKPAPAQHATFYRWDGQLNAPVDREAFRLFAQLLQAHFFRTKGLVRFLNAPDEVYSLNAVGRHAVIQRVPQAAANGPALQLIGINPAPVGDISAIDAALLELSGH